MAYQLFIVQPTGSFQVLSADFKQIWNVQLLLKLLRIEDYIEILFLFVFFDVILLYRPVRFDGLSKGSFYQVS